MKILCSKNISQCGLSQQFGGVVRVLHVCDRDGCIGYTVEDNSINSDCHIVFGQDLLRWNLHLGGPHVNNLHMLNAGKLKMEARSQRSSLLKSA